MMGNLPSITDNGVTVSRKSTWSTMSTGQGPAITEHTETITEYGVAREKFTTTESWPRSDLRGGLQEEGLGGNRRAPPSAPASETMFPQGAPPSAPASETMFPQGAPPSAPASETMFPQGAPPSAPASETMFPQGAPPSAPASKSMFPTTTDACPRPDVTGDLPPCGGNQGALPSAPASESKADMKMDEGEEFDLLHDLEDKETPETRPTHNGDDSERLPLGEMGTPPCGVLPTDQENPLPVNDKHRKLPQHSSHDEKDPPPPYTPGNPPEYTEHQKEAASPPESVTMEADPRENLDHAQAHQQGPNPNPSQSDMDSMAPCPSGSGSGNIFSRFFGRPKEAAKMERDTVYKTKNIETARAMMKCDEESEKKMMDITQAILDDLAGK